MSTGAERIRLDGITKRFPGVLALSEVSLAARAGEALALVGENGAGKSTLMKVLSGVYPAGSYAGNIFVDGERCRFASPRDAEAAGIVIIHQELAAFAHLTVAENLFVGRWPKRFGLVDNKRLERDAAQWLERVGAKCGPSDLMGALTVGTQQLVEIARALAKNARVLILDEPTSALPPQEVERLLSLLKELKRQGTALVYISHKFEEVYALCDRITVLRDGKSVHTAPAASLPEDELVRHMVGRPLDRLFPELPARAFADVAFDLAPYLPAPASLHDELKIRRGEIVGLAGLLGAGRTEALKRAFQRPPRSITGGLFYVSEDRKRESIFPRRSVDENIALSRLATASLARPVRPSKEEKRSRDAIARWRVRCSGPEQSIETLSGGNQQKAVLARALEVAPKVLFLDEPTRGVDVGARSEIYESLARLAKDGLALVVASSDLPELMGLCDRILVLHQGGCQGSLPRVNFSQEAILRLAIGRANA